MLDVRTLDRRERVFLAGSIKSMILADGRIDNEELDDVDKIVKTYHFDDFDSALYEFENEVSTSDDIWDMAQRITRPGAQELILKILNEVSVQDGFRDYNQDDLMEKLQLLWNR